MRRRFQYGTAGYVGNALHAGIDGNIQGIGNTVVMPVFHRERARYIHTRHKGYVHAGNLADGLQIAYGGGLLGCEGVHVYLGVYGPFARGRRKLFYVHLGGLRIFLYFRLLLRRFFCRFFGLGDDFGNAAGFRLHIDAPGVVGSFNCLECAGMICLKRI